MKFSGYPNKNMQNLYLAYSKLYRDQKPVGGVCVRAHARTHVHVHVLKYFTNTSQRIPLMALWIGSQIFPEAQVF